MKKAVLDVRNGVLKLRVASRAYAVPLTTLQRRVSSKLETIGHCSGRKTLISNADERILADHLKYMSSCGFPLSPKQVMNLALGLRVKGKFSYTWLASFCKRNNLSYRKAENLSKARAAAINKPVLTKWFKDYEQKLEDLAIVNPNNIWNMDESGIQLTFTKCQVVAETGCKNVHTIVPGEKGETVTIIGCVNAAGKFMAPTVLMRGKRLSEALKDSAHEGPEGTKIFATDKGYITDEILIKWGEHFLKNRLDKKNPNILILDGHSTHVFNLEFLSMMKEAGVTVYALPPHTTHYTQPLDVAVFKSMKSHWNQFAGEAFQLDPVNGVTRLGFMKIFRKVWEECATVKNAQSGFRRSGIYPVNIDAIPETSYSTALASDRPLQGGNQSGSESSDNNSDDILPLRERIMTLSSLPRIERPAAKRNVQRYRPPAELTSDSHVNVVKIKASSSGSQMPTKSTKRNANSSAASSNPTNSSNFKAIQKRNPGSVSKGDKNTCCVCSTDFKNSSED